MNSGAGGGVASAALRAAASGGDVATCARILGPARMVRFSRDELGRSALHLAASAGHTAVVRLLLNVAAPREADSPDGAGCTALQRAAADGHEDVVILLLSRGADVNKQDNVHGNCALHESSWKGYSRTVSILAKAGANLSQTNAGGFTALHLCCQNGHNQSCRELLLAGCQPDLQNNYGDTALHTSARYGHAGVTRILISAKCQVSEQNKNGDTALHIAAAMGRRKLTRILLEAGCDKSVRNKQNETARDIALRKDLNEILAILDESSSKKEKKAKAAKKRGKSKVRFDPKSTENNDHLIKSKHWSPYGCHYYPDPEAFPSPRLDTLPDEPLKRGEQYYLDLAGNICKGPVGVGYTCYCAPLFRHLEARLEKDKRELQRAQVRLGQRVAGLEQKLSRSNHGRRSERVHSNREPQPTSLPRSRSLELLDKLEESRTGLQATRSMDELDPAEDSRANEEPRPSVKELVARIQQQHGSQEDAQNPEDNSESSEDEEDSPLRLTQQMGPMGQSNLLQVEVHNYENVPNGPPRSRMGMYSPSNLVNPPPAPETVTYFKANSEVTQPNPRTYISTARIPQCAEAAPAYRTFDPGAQFYEEDVRYADTHAHARYDLGTRFAKLRVLDSTKYYDSTKNCLDGKSRMLDSSKMFESTTRMLENPQDVIDRDTNNDSGYSTKVYGSSKGNSPCLSGQTENECLGTSSSLV